MRLTDVEKRMLDGGYGAARQKAMELIVRYAGVLGADSLCRVTWADLFCGCHAYLDVVKSTAFDTVFSKMSLCSDETVILDNMAGECVCYSGVEADTSETPLHMYMPKEKRERDMAWLKRFVDAGVVLSGNCIPYLTGFIPMRGEHFVSCESSAVLIMNSLWGAMANGDGIEASFCAAVCGRTPEWGFHLHEKRAATISVNIACDPHDVHDWDVMGHALGVKLAPGSVPFLTGRFSKPDIFKLKAFSAALACTAGTEMMHIEGLTPEGPDKRSAFQGKACRDFITITKKDLEASKQFLTPHNKDKIDYISLGCPHYHIEEIRKTAGMLDGKKIHPATILHIWTTGPFKHMADRCGYTKTIENAGGLILTGSCPSTRGYPKGVAAAAYDSVKQRLSAAQETDAKLYYGTLPQLIASAVSGFWEEK